MLQYKGDDQFDEVEHIMRTSFATRIDTESMTNAGLDIDYFENSQRHSKLQFLEEKVKNLEAEFKQMTTNNDNRIKLAELMQDPTVKQLLEELRLAKKQAQGLRYAIEDSVAEAKKADEEQAEDEKNTASRREDRN